MKCPVCEDTILNMTERKGIEIDYCPKCRGVWLDRGELDKLLEKEEAEQQRYDDRSYSNDRYRDSYRESDYRNYDDKKYYDKDYKYGYKKKKKSPFEIFDIFD